MCCHIVLQEDLDYFFKGLAYVGKKADRSIDDNDDDEKNKKKKIIWPSSSLLSFRNWLEGNLPVTER